MKSNFLSYLVARLLQMLGVLFVIATILFFIFRLMPGNPLTAFISPTFTPEEQHSLMVSFGLDKPLWMQYLIYLKDLATGNLGQSFFFHEQVSRLIGEVLPNTLLLTVTALIVAYVVGAIGGIVTAWKRNTWIERVGIIGTLVTRSAPQFWVGMILLALFSFTFAWFPSGGIAKAGVDYPTFLAQLTSGDFWWHLTLPAFTLAFYLLGLPLLLMRNSMLDVMKQDFVTVSRMKGLSEWWIMTRHVARNALLPVVTAMSLGVGYSIGGNVVIENVFSWPGIGRLLVKAVSTQDYPLAQGAFFLIAVIMVSMNLVADLLYAWLDPRVNIGGKGASR